MDLQNYNDNDEQQQMSDSNTDFVGGGSTSGGETDDASQSTSPDSSSRNSVKTANSNSNDYVSTLAKREGRNVRIWRRNVFLMLFVTAALLTSLTYVFLKKEDEEDFDTSVR